MNVNAASVSNQYATPNNQVVAVSQSKKTDTDGDYDKNSGQDDLMQKKALQMAAQPYLGSNINIEA